MKKLIYSLFPILSIAFVSSVYAKDISEDNSFNRLKELGTLRVCSQAGFIPFEMKDNKGNWKGFDVDIMSEFSKQNSLKLQMIDTSMDGLIPALITGKCDLIASGLTTTEERKKAVLFSNPTYTVVVAGALLDTPENKRKYKKFTDIDAKGVKIATHTGTAAAVYLKSTIKNADLLQFSTQNDEVNALIQKQADILVEDDVFISQASKEMKIKFYTLFSEEKGDLAMATRKKDIQLMQKFNEFLDKIKKNGQYETLKKNYFN